MPLRERLLAASGIVGPAVFIADWATLGTRAKNYSPVSDAISELARMHAPTRPAMTVGFVVLGAALPAYAVIVRDALPGRTWQVVAAHGVATLGVAAFSLGTPMSGTVHGVFAGAAYAALAATPIVAASRLRSRGQRKLAQVSVATGVVCGAVLLASVVGPTGVHGLLQRVGLTLGDVWLMTSAATLLRRPPVDVRARPAARRV
jgi:hypothetical membrane protein